MPLLVTSGAGRGTGEGAGFWRRRVPSCAATGLADGTPGLEDATAGTFAAIMLAPGAWIAACGSSDKSAEEEQANANFAGQGNRAGAKTCNVDLDCDNHDPCTNFRCDRGSGELTVGQCVYTLGSGEACRGAVDAGITVVTPLPDPEPRDAGGAPPEPTDSGPGVDAGAQADASPTEAGTDAGGVSDAGPTTCNDSLSVTKFTNTGLATCTFNTTVQQSSPATLTYPCAGGAASVTFGAQTFTGTDSGGTVSLQNVSKFSFTNTKYNVTCVFVATQNIKGDLASGKLTYDYVDVLDAKQPALCPFVTSGCTATGEITVQ